MKVTGFCCIEYVLFQQLIEFVYLMTVPCPYVAQNKIVV
jgi:hypothetical protein